MNNYFNSNKWKQFLKENKKMDEGCGMSPMPPAPAPMPAEQPSSDHEGEMARSQLQQAAEASASLMSLIQDGENLPAWVQAKLTKASDYLDSVRRYMEYKETPQASLEESAWAQGKTGDSLEHARELIADARKTLDSSLDFEYELKTDRVDWESIVKSLSEAERTILNYADSKPMQEENQNEGRSISYSDVRQEYDAILGFLKKDILQKQGSKYVADALEMLANDVRDGLHNPDPYDKENYAYFDRESGTQPNMKEAVSPEQQEANEKAYSRCFEMGRKGIDVKSALRSGPTADFAACRAGHQDGANEFRQSLPSEHSLEERIKKTVMRKLQEKAKSKNQQQFMGMVKKCQETGDCASAEVKKAADSMKKGDVDDFARTKHKGLPDTVEDKK